MREHVVSIVIPIFNAAKFLDETLASVFGQTYRSWNLLLVDDGSTDGSADLARACAKANPDQVRYLEHEDHQNRGQSATRNLGIGEASSPIIALLDSDDIWLPEKLERQMAAFDAYPAVGMVCGPSLYWYSWTGDPVDRSLDRLSTTHPPQDAVLEPPDLLTLMLRNAFVPTMSNVVFTREAFRNAGGFEDKVFVGDNEAFEDQAFLAKVALSSQVFATNAWYDRYRRRTDSHNPRAKATGRWESSRRFFLEWVRALLEERDLQGTEVWRTVQRQLWSYRHPALQKLRSLAGHWKSRLLPARHETTGPVP